MTTAADRFTPAAPAAQLRQQAMEAAKAEAADYLDNAVEIINEKLDENASPEQLARVHRLLGSYLALAGAALERFQEAARA